MQNSSENLIKAWFPRTAVWNPGYSVHKQRAVWQSNATSPLGPRLHHSPSADSPARWPLAQITVPPAEPPSQAKTSKVETFSLLLAMSIIDCQRGGFHSKLNSPACCCSQISVVSLSQNCTNGSALYKLSFPISNTVFCLLVSLSPQMQTVSPRSCSPGSNLSPSWSHIGSFYFLLLKSCSPDLSCLLPCDHSPSPWLIPATGAWVLSPCQLPISLVLRSVFKGVFTSLLLPEQ